MPTRRAHSGPRSATQLASYLDAHLGTVTQLAKPAVTLSAFGGDAQLKAERIARLRDYLELKQADPNTPMWPEKVTGALAFVAGTSDPDECAVALGMPTDVLETVRMLSSYRGTNFNAAVFVADWLESVLVGANLSALPRRLLNAVLASPLLSDTLGGDAALLAIRARWPRCMLRRWTARTRRTRGGRPSRKRPRRQPPGPPKGTGQGPPPCW
ncbi:hypothetical protein [Burkholderia glumae]|uniref:hypothetical protein n=1 Tax=Burkholderia glumae TaxID=337 RepID=UPI0021517F0F|nr:hypothetical protein [Burkholderia glumae]